MIKITTKLVSVRFDRVAISNAVNPLPAKLTTCEAFLRFGVAKVFLWINLSTKTGFIIPKTNVQTGGTDDRIAVFVNFKSKTWEMYKQ